METTPNNPVPTSQNPLSKYFRQPSIYMKLPSNGQYWPQGSLDLPVTGEIPVYPMTARDEITLRTPDALLNGSGVVDVIQSCCPCITDAWKMPSVDVDAVLIAIRIASYGQEMTVDTVCPFCSAENSHSLDLRVNLANIVCPDYSKRIEVDDLKIKIAPQAYFGVNRKNTIAFEEERMTKALEQEDSEQRMKEIGESMIRLIQISIDTVTDSTEYIELSDGSRVDDKTFIKEFYTNASGNVVKTIQTKIVEINSTATVKQQTAQCTECQQEYQIPLMFDYANFFADGS